MGVLGTRRVVPWAVVTAVVWSGFAAAGGGTPWVGECEGRTSTDLGLPVGGLHASCDADYTCVDGCILLLEAEGTGVVSGTATPSAAPTEHCGPAVGDCWNLIPLPAGSGSVHCTTSLLTDDPTPQSALPNAALESVVRCRIAD